MPFVAWLRLFWMLIIFDIKTTIPTKIKIFILETKLKYKNWTYKKLYEDRSAPFIIIYIPKLMFDSIRDALSAKKLGISLEDFYRQQTERLTAETERLTKENHKKKMETMTDFINAVPEATTHGYHEFIEELPLLSIRFLVNSIVDLFRD